MILFTANPRQDHLLTEQEKKLLKNRKNDTVYHCKK
jgi:hypothetical protein